MNGIEQVFVPLTGKWWEPSGDPDQYRLVEGCGDDCHHPVHAFGIPRPAHHLEEAAWVLRNATERSIRPEPCVAPPGNLCTETGCWDVDRCVVYRPGERA